MTSFALTSLLKAPSPDTVTVGLGLPHLNLGTQSCSNTGKGEAEPGLRVLGDRGPHSGSSGCFRGPDMGMNLGI